MRRNDKAEKFQSNAMIAILIALIGIAGFTFFFINSKEESSPIETKIANHDIYINKQDGSFSLFNTKEKKYLKQHILANETTLDKTETHINIFATSKDSKNIYAASPYSKELVVLSEEEKGFKEVKRLKTKDIVQNFKIVNESAFVSYKNKSNVDVYDLNSGKVIKTATFKENVDSIEVDDKNLYAGSGNYVEILPLDNLDTSKSTKIHTGAKTISILKSNDGFLYAANTFATDAGNSVLVKIDVNKQHVEDILPIGKEYPINMFEREDYLYILCQGLTDNTLDGISIINKDDFKKYKSVLTGETPNSFTHTEDGYIYVSHEDGKVSIIDAKNDFNTESSITINGAKSIIIK